MKVAQLFPSVFFPFWLTSILAFIWSFAVELSSTTNDTKTNKAVLRRFFLQTNADKQISHHCYEQCHFVCIFDEIAS